MPSLGHDLLDGLLEPAIAKPLDTVIERPDARQDHGVGAPQVVGRAADDRVRADVQQGLLHAAEVAFSVVDDRDHAAVRPFRTAAAGSREGAHKSRHGYLWRH